MEKNDNEGFKGLMKRPIHLISCLSPCSVYQFLEGDCNLKRFQRKNSICKKCGFKKDKNQKKRKISPTISFQPPNRINVYTQTKKNSIAIETEDKTTNTNVEVQQNTENFSFSIPPIKHSRLPKSILAPSVDKNIQTNGKVSQHCVDDKICPCAKKGISCPLYSTEGQRYRTLHEDPQPAIVKRNTPNFQKVESSVQTDLHLKDLKLVQITEHRTTQTEVHGVKDFNKDASMQTNLLLNDIIIAQPSKPVSTQTDMIPSDTRARHSIITVESLTSLTSPQPNHPKTEEMPKKNSHPDRKVISSKNLEKKLKSGSSRHVKKEKGNKSSTKGKQKLFVNTPPPTRQHSALSQETSQ